MFGGSKPSPETVRWLEDAAIMREFLRSQYYEVLKRHYDIRLGELKDQAIRGSKDQFEYLKGVYFGAMDATQFPEVIIAAAEEMARRKT